MKCKTIKMRDKTEYINKLRKLKMKGWEVKVEREIIRYNMGEQILLIYNSSSNVGLLNIYEYEALLIKHKKEKK